MDIRRTRQAPLSKAEPPGARSLWRKAYDVLQGYYTPENENGPGSNGTLKECFPLQTSGFQGLC